MTPGPNGGVPPKPAAPVAPGGPPPPPPERHARVTLHAERHAGVTLGAEGGQAKVSLRSGSGPNLKCRPVIPVGITRT